MMSGDLTKARVEHVQCHLVALLRSSDGNKALVAVVGRFVDFDDATAQLSNLVDLSTTLTNDGSDHIVGDVDLLCKRLRYVSEGPSSRYSRRRRSDLPDQVPERVFERALHRGHVRLGQQDVRRRGQLAA